MPGKFPKLRTNAIAQYPATRTVQFRNQVILFLDGTGQRYRDSSEPLRQWEIRLDQLDETEMTAIEQFFADNQGEFGAFEFTDPWDGRIYTNCSFASNDLVLTWLDERKGQTEVVVKQNQS